MKVCRADVQIEVAQRVLQAFIAEGSDTYDAFIRCWEDSDGVKIHEGSSPRSLQYGHLQTAYSTFIGFCSPSRSNIEKRGGIFGLYLTYSTQFCQHPSPILISASEMKDITSFCKEEGQQICAAIINKLLCNDSICFSPFPVAIETPDARFPSPVVVNERMIFDSVFEASREVSEEKRPIDVEDNDIDALMDEYHSILDQIRSI